MKTVKFHTKNLINIDKYVILVSYLAERRKTDHVFTLVWIYFVHLKLMLDDN